MSMSISDISPKLHLLRTMFHQIATDAGSPEPRYRKDVQRFLREGGLQWWNAFLGCGGVLERAMQRRLAARLSQHSQRESPQLAFRFSEEP